MMDNHTSSYIKLLIDIYQKVENKKINLLKTKIKDFIGQDKTLFVCGNGGSAATASHMCCDLSKTILKKNPRQNTNRIRVICLNDNIPIMTAWGNDEGYQYIFSEQLKNLGRKGDLLFIITGSGNSANILEVIKTAKEKNIETFGLLGFNGGKAKDLLDDYILVESNDYGIIEDIHGSINHLITDYLKKQ